MFCCLDPDLTGLDRIGSDQHFKAWIQTSNWSGIGLWNSREQIGIFMNDLTQNGSDDQATLDFEKEKKINN